MQRLILYHGISSVFYSLWGHETAKKLWSNNKPFRFKSTLSAFTSSIYLVYFWEMDDYSCCHINVLEQDCNNIDLICHFSTWFYIIYIVSYYLIWWLYFRNIFSFRFLKNLHFNDWLGSEYVSDTPCHKSSTRFNRYSIGHMWISL